MSTARKQGVSVGQCFGATEGDASAFEDVRTRFLAAGGSADAWTLRLSREAMAQALTFAEDRAELRRGAYAVVRGRLRAVRRRLEVELWG